VAGVRAGQIRCGGTQGQVEAVGGQVGRHRRAWYRAARPPGRAASPRCTIMVLNRVWREEARRRPSDRRFSTPARIRDVSIIDRARPANSLKTGIHTQDRYPRWPCWRACSGTPI